MFANHKLSRALLSVVAFALATALLALFVWRAGDMRELAGIVKSAFTQRPLWLLAGMTLFCVSLLCGLLRWFVLLRALKLPVSFSAALRLYATGHFFNVLGPGATGGDLVKAAWMAAKIPYGLRTVAITSIAAERLIGLMAMFVFISFVSFFRADFFAATKTLTTLRNLVLLAFAGSVVLFILLTAIDWERVAGKIKMRDGCFIAKLIAIILKIWRTFKICLTHPKAALAAFSLSILNHITDVFCYFLLSRALAMTVPFCDMVVVSPLANLSAAIPLTPGGAGLRENALQYMMNAAKVPVAQSTALGLLMLASIIIWALICGVIMIFGKRKCGVAAC